MKYLCTIDQLIYCIIYLIYIIQIYIKNKKKNKNKEKNKITKEKEKKKNETLTSHLSFYLILLIILYSKEEKFKNSYKDFLQQTILFYMNHSTKSINYIYNFVIFIYSYFSLNYNLSIDILYKLFLKKKKKIQNIKYGHNQNCTSIPLENLYQFLGNKISMKQNYEKKHFVNNESNNKNISINNSQNTKGSNIPNTNQIKNMFNNINVVNNKSVYMDNVLNTNIEKGNIKNKNSHTNVGNNNYDVNYDRS